MRYFYIFIFFTLTISGQYNFDNLEKRMRQFIDEKELVGFQAMIIKEGEMIHYDKYGFADLEQKKTNSRQ